MTKHYCVSCDKYFHEDEDEWGDHEELCMTLKEWLTAFTLKETIAEHPLWSNQRSPHALMIDCIHIVGKYTKNKAVTQLKIQNKTKELWGI